MLDNTKNQVMPRATVETIVAHRNRTLTLYGVAHDKLEEAAAAVAAAVDAGRLAAPRKNSFNSEENENARRHLLDGVSVPPRAEYMESVRRVIDTAVWAHVIEQTDLERLMDKKAKDQFRKELQDNPPEVTTENIYATLEGFMVDAKLIFQRGIAEVFSNLDRRFRSHTGWKFGGRVILSHAFNDFGSWNYHRNHDDTLRDIERTFMILDGKEAPANYTSIVSILSAKRGWGRQQTYAENEYFRIRCWLNGNAHIYFKRDDLLKRVNQMLAEYYGEVIPEEREPDEDTGLNTPKTSLAKNYGFFPTPEAAAHRLLASAPLYRSKGEPKITCLEPSAGTGNLARLAAGKDVIVDCIEIQPQLAASLKASKLYRKVTNADFLACQPDPDNLYDVVLMNPPFDLERDIDHVMHAMNFLKPGGYLAAIMSAGTEFRETKKSRAFRDLMQKLKARWEDLPAGSFRESGTNVNTLIVRFYKDGRRIW